MHNLNSRLESHRLIGIFVVLALASAAARGDDGPVGRIYHSILTLNDGSLLMFGGVSRHGFGPLDLRDTWMFDVENRSWERVGDFEPGDVIGAAYDASSNKVITLNFEGETWAFDPAERQWERRNPANGPSGRCGHGMVYDSESDRTILFGGFACTSVDDPMLNDTWSYNYDSDSWTQHLSESAPPARMYHSMVYHDDTDRTVVWGGRVEDSRVWTYDLEANNWVALMQTSFPQGIRSYQSVAVHPESSRMFVFGGLVLTEPLSFEGQMLDELWTYDLTKNQWALHRLAEGPSARSHHAMTLAKNGKFIVFGGELNSPYSDEMSDELWVLDPETISWSLLSPR